MDLENQTYIEKCPVCSGSHTYELDVARKAVQVRVSPYAETDTAFTPSDLVFICPKENKEFRKTVPVYHRPYEYINSVEAKPAEDE